jgi:hypothetical protein
MMASELHIPKALVEDLIYWFIFLTGYIQAKGDETLSDKVYGIHLKLKELL